MIAGSDNFDIKQVGVEKLPFIGYISALDKTVAPINALVQGSYNVYKTLAGTLAARFGLKLRGTRDEAVNGIVASYEWNDSTNRCLPIRVLASGDLQFESDIADGSTLVWYTLANFVKTRFVFAPWWNDSEKKDELIMVNGDHNLYAWGGGIAVTGVTSESNSVLFSATGAILKSPVSFIQFGNGTDNAVAVFTSNAIAGQTIEYDVGGNQTFISFVSTLTTAVSNAGQVVVGTTLEDTINNLLAYLHNPGSLTAINFRGMTDGTLISAVSGGTYSLSLSLGITGDLSYAERGFIDGAGVIIDGITYTYVAVAGSWLAGISTAPPEGAVAYQALVTNTNTPSDDFANDFITVFLNQLCVGSYTSRLVYISSDSDYADFSVDDLIHLVGSPDVLTLDSNPTGITSRQGGIQIGAGTADWYEVTFSQTSPVSTSGGDEVLIVNFAQVAKKAVADLTAPLAQEFIANRGDDIYYLGQDHQLYIYGSFTDQFSNRFPSLSQGIRQELIDTDFTGGALRAVGDYLYLTAPVDNKTYVFEDRQEINKSGQIVADRFWNPPQIWGISRIAVIDGVTYGNSAYNPQTYQLYDTDQWHDDSPSGIPQSYEVRMRFAYNSEGRRQGVVSFDKLYTEGYMNPNTSLNALIRYEYLGAEGTELLVINNVDDPAESFAYALTTIGSAEIGTSEIGGSNTAFDQDSLPKWKAINTTSQTNSTEYQVEIYSIEADSRWELICYGTNAQLDFAQSTSLVK